MFGWFGKKPRRLLPESNWMVAMDGDLIKVIDDAGAIKSVAKDELSGVAIETNDSGPWGADFWWLFFDSSDQLACAFPQGATGEEAVIEYLSGLSSFNHGEMAKAMTSTSNATFALWRRQT